MDVDSPYSVGRVRVKTPKAKGKSRARRGDMRMVSALLDLYGACLRNASDLLAEAQLLLANGHVARAFALAYTGWEEVGKAQLVGDFTNEMVAEEEFEAAFRDHKLKVAYNWRRFVLNPEDVTDSTIEYDRSRAEVPFEKRQAALYVNKDSSLGPSLPRDAVSKLETESIITALEKELKEIRELDYLTGALAQSPF